MSNHEGADLSGVLGKLLENPEALQSAMAIASSLKNSGALDGILNGSAEKSTLSDRPSENAVRSNDNDPSGSSTGRSDSSAEATEQKEELAYKAEKSTYNKGASPALSPLSESKEGNKEGQSGQRRQLLLALRPYMSRERQEKIDTILRILQLLELAGQLGLSDLGRKQ